MQVKEWLAERNAQLVLFPSPRPSFVARRCMCLKMFSEAFGIYLVLSARRWDVYEWLINQGLRAP